MRRESAGADECVRMKSWRREVGTGVAQTGQTGSGGVSFGIVAEDPGKEIVLDDVLKFGEDRGVVREDDGEEASSI